MKIFNSEENFQSGENSQLFQKFYTLGKTRNLEENFKLRRNFPSQKKILNSGENSELMEKFLNSWENSQLRIKFSTQAKTFNSEQISQSGEDSQLF